MHKIQKYSINLHEYHALLIREEDYMHRRPCDIVTHRYNKIVALYNKDQNFAKLFLISTKIKLAYIISGNIDTLLSLLNNESIEISENFVVHSHEIDNNGDIKIREIYSEMLIGEAIHREHTQMIIDNIGRNKHDTF